MTRFLRTLPNVLAGLALCAGLSGLPSGEGSRRDAYVLALGKDTFSTNLNFDSFARMREGRSGDFLWFRRNGSSYLIEDPATLREVRAFDWKLGKLVSAAFGPDGSLAAGGTEDGQVVVWDVDL